MCILLTLHIFYYDIYAFSFKDYIFSLLTGYHDPPAGVKLPEGVHYNPYFPGGLIAMAQALYDEIIEYEDGKSLLGFTGTLQFQTNDSPSFDRPSLLNSKLLPNDHLLITQ